VSVVKGFDSTARFGNSRLTSLHKDGYRIAGFYLGGPEAAVVHPARYVRRLYKQGFSPMPIYVGPQQATVGVLNQAELVNLGRTEAARAVQTAIALKKRIPHVPLCDLPLDWEGPMSEQGAIYCREFLDSVAGRQFLYRTDAGVDTPERHLWLTHPATSETAAISMLSGRPNSPTQLGQVLGVQNEWLPDIDYSQWDSSVLPTPVNRVPGVKKHKGR
jgi:hypothetical protein